MSTFLILHIQLYSRLRLIKCLMKLMNPQWFAVGGGRWFWFWAWSYLFSENRCLSIPEFLVSWFEDCWWVAWFLLVVATCTPAMVAHFILWRWDLIGCDCGARPGYLHPLGALASWSVQAQLKYGFAIIGSWSV